MRLRKSYWLTFWVLLCALGSAQAGIYYQAKTTGEGKAAEMEEAVVKAWVSEGNAKVLSSSSVPPIAKKCRS